MTSNTSRSSRSFYRDGAAGVRVALDSPLEESGFELVWGFSCQVVVFGLLQFFVRSGKGRSSFFNRAAGVKKVFRLRFQENSASMLEACHRPSVVPLLA